jgi:hypothetical protein
MAARCSTVGTHTAGRRTGRQQCPLKVVEQSGTALFVVQEMRQPRYGDAPAALPIAPDPQHRLLRHRATGEHHRSGPTNQRGDLVL